MGRTHDHAVRRDTTFRSFRDPRGSRRSEDEVSELLGEHAIRELRSLAGLPGDYTPERLFGGTAKRLADAIRTHNREVSDGLASQIKEWADP